MYPDKSASVQNNLHCPESNAEMIFELEKGVKLNPVVFYSIVFNYASNISEENFAEIQKLYPIY